MKSGIGLLTSATTHWKFAHRRCITSLIPPEQRPNFHPPRHPNEKHADPYGNNILMWSSPVSLQRIMRNRKSVWSNVVVVRQITADWCRGVAWSHALVSAILQTLFGEKGVGADVILTSRIMGSHRNSDHFSCRMMSRVLVAMDHEYWYNIVFLWKPT